MSRLPLFMLFFLVTAANATSIVEVSPSDFVNPTINVFGNDPYTEAGATFTAPDSAAAVSSGSHLNLYHSPGRFSLQVSLPTLQNRFGFDVLTLWPSTDPWLYAVSLYSDHASGILQSCGNSVNWISRRGRVLRPRLGTSLPVY